MPLPGSYLDSKARYQVDLLLGEISMFLQERNKMLADTVKVRYGLPSSVFDKPDGPYNRLEGTTAIAENDKSRSAPNRPGRRTSLHDLTAGEWRIEHQVDLLVMQTNGLVRRSPNEPKHPFLCL
jgi:hypothetical protein